MSFDAGILSKTPGMHLTGPVHKHDLLGMSAFGLQAALPAMPATSSTLPEVSNKDEACLV